MERGSWRGNLHTVQSGELGTNDTPWIVWEMRARELEEAWATAFTDGSGLDNKAVGGFCANPNRLTKGPDTDLSGDQYLGIKATHFEGELAGIALALEDHTVTNMVALLTDCKPTIQVVVKIDSGTAAP